MVNEELWNEVQTYGDIQLMPFIDYYTLITWKTVAICTFGVSLQLFFRERKFLALANYISFLFLNRRKLFLQSI